jgi:two-component system NarL family sensor kinase
VQGVRNLPKTGYKIFDRYQECGVEGLTDRSRRPYRSANKLPFQVENGGIAIELDISPNFERLPRDLELAVFRVVQEGLTNIHRHSGSKRASIRITRDASVVTLQIEDYGKGIPAEQLAAVQSGLSELGIRAMRERPRPFRAELQISSSDSSTRVLVTIPQPAAPVQENGIEPLRATI